MAGAGGGFGGGEVAGAEGLAEEAGEIGGGLEGEVGGEGGAPGEEVLGEVGRDGAGPGFGGGRVLEAKRGESDADGVGGGEVELVVRGIGGGRGRVAGGEPLPAVEAGPVLGDGRVGGFGDEPGAELGGEKVFIGLGLGEPELKAGTQGDVDEFGFEGGGQAEAEGVEAGGEIGVAEGGDGEAGGGEGTGAAPEFLVDEVEGRGVEEDGGEVRRQGVAGGVAELEGEVGGVVGQGSGVKLEGGVFDVPGGSVGQGNGGAGRGIGDELREEIGGDCGRGEDGVAEGRGGEAEVEEDGAGGLRKGVDGGEVELGYGAQPGLGGGAPGFAVGGVGEELGGAVGGEDDAQIVVKRGGGGGAGEERVGRRRGGRQGVAPVLEVGGDENIGDALAHGGQIGLRGEGGGEGAAGVFPGQGDVLPEGPGIGGALAGGPPIGEGGFPELVVGRFPGGGETVAVHGVAGEAAEVLQLLEEGGKLAEEAAFFGGEGATESGGELRFPDLAKGAAMGRWRGGRAAVGVIGEDLAGAAAEEVIEPERAERVGVFAVAADGAGAVGIPVLPVELQGGGIGLGAGALDVGGEDVAVFPKIEDGAAFDVGARALAGALIVVVEVGGEGGEGDFGVERSVGHEQAGNKERLHVEPRRVFAQM